MKVALSRKAGAVLKRSRESVCSLCARERCVNYGAPCSLLVATREIALFVLRFICVVVAAVAVVLAARFCNNSNANHRDKVRANSISRSRARNLFSKFVSPAPAR